jgi:putative FmdB family regulatory protein
MPTYEFQCASCGTRREVFVRSMSSAVPEQACGAKGCKGEMQRVVSAFVRHRTLADQVADAEAKFGKEVDGAMGSGPDVGKLARRYDKLAKDLPPSENG